MAAKFALLTLMTSLLSSPAPAYSDVQAGFRATLTRRAGVATNITHAVRQSHRRLTSMLGARLDVAAQTPLRIEDDDGHHYAYHDMELAIGTPPQKLKAVADTGSNLVWTKCSPCTACEPRGSPSYYPNASSTFLKLPCSDPICDVVHSRALIAACSDGGAECDYYLYAYGYGFSNNPYAVGLTGYLASETFTLGGAAVPGVGFGCTNKTVRQAGTTSSGIVGLGRGPESLVSQLGVSAFSYCLTSITSKSSKESPLLFGSLANLSGPSVQSVRLLPSDTYYTIDLKNISIGNMTTAGAGEDGVVFDSGTVLTFLEEPAYTQAKEAVLSQTKLARAPDNETLGFEACFRKAGDSTDLQAVVPSMVLHLDGADMALPVENYFMDLGEGVICWIVQRSPAGSVSLIGNLMQMNHHIRFDIDNSVMSFEQANCDILESPKVQEGTSDSRSVQEGYPFRVSLATAAAVVLLLLLH
ncbi:hypothetical protein ACP4OV_015112 [Aristida adscensionis]